MNTQTQQTNIAITTVASQHVPAWLAALGGLVTLAAAMGIGRFAYTPLLPRLQDALGWSVAQAGDVASANYLGYMLGALLAALLARRPARRGWLLVGMILSAGMSGAGALVMALPVWLLIRFWAGVASAFCFVLSTAIVMQHLGRQARPRYSALHFAGIGTGIVISVLVIDIAQRAGATVFGQWAALGLAALGLLASGWWILRRLPDAQPAVTDPGIAPGVSPATHTELPHASAHARRRFNRLLIAYALFGFGYVVTATFIVAIARRLEGSTLQAVWLEPLTWLVVGLVAAPSVLLWQGVVQRVGIFTALRLAYGLQAAGVMLAGLAAGPVAVVIGGALLGGTFVGMTALGLTAGRQLAPGRQDSAIGWMTAAFGLGQLLGPAVAGRLAQMTGSFALPSLLAAILLMLGIVLLWNLEKTASRSVL